MAPRRIYYRTPFNFRQRIELAYIYLKDGALFTCAARLRALADEIESHAKSEQSFFNVERIGGETGHLDNGQ